MISGIRFSIVIPTHCRADILRRAVSSVLEQRFPAYQIIVVSDAFDPDSYALCRELLRPGDVFLQRIGASGPALSRNLGLKNVKGNYVIFLDDDDAFEPDYLDQIASLIHTCERDEIVYVNSRVEDVGDETKCRHVDLAAAVPELVFVKNFIPNNALVFPANIACRVEFDSRIAYEDWDYLLSTLQYGKLRFLPVGGPIVFKNSDQNVSRGVMNRPKVIDCYYEVYRRHAAPTAEIDELRKGFLHSNGLDYEYQIYETSFDEERIGLPKGFLPKVLLSLERPIRVLLLDAQDGLAGTPMARIPFSDHLLPSVKRMLSSWCTLFLYGRQRGFHLLTCADLDENVQLDAVVFLGGGGFPPNSNAEKFLANTKLKRYLVLLESPVDTPACYLTEYLNRFDRVFTWRDDLIDASRYIGYRSIIPASCVSSLDALAVFYDRRLLTMVADFKQTTHPAALFEDRLRLAHWFAAEQPEDLTIYGAGWGNAGLPQVFSPPVDRIETLSDYRFAICYEQAQGFPGEISEQLLDCFAAGCVPIYGGAPNVAQWIPEQAFIRINAFSTYRELFEYINQMGVSEYSNYIKAIRSFVQSPAAKPFSLAQRIDTLITTITSDLNRAITQ